MRESRQRSEKHTQVSREGQELLTDEHVEGVEGGVAEVLFPVDPLLFLDVLRRKAEAGSRLGHVHLVAFHTGMIHVVTVMGDLPAEVGCPHYAMRNEADNIVDPAVRAEGTVAALVSDDPDTGEVQALEPPVGEPSGAAIERVRKGRNVCGQGPEESSQGSIARKISKAQRRVTDEELRRDSSANLGKRVRKGSENRKLRLVLHWSERLSRLVGKLGVLEGGGGNSSGGHCCIRSRVQCPYILAKALPKLNRGYIGSQPPFLRGVGYEVSEAICKCIDVNFTEISIDPSRCVPTCTIP